MGYASFGEIIGLARQVRDLAAKRKAEELDWCKKGTYSDHDFQTKNVPNTVKGGSSADYAALEAGYEWVIPLFENATGPDPSGFTAMSQSMIDARAALRGGGVNPPMRVKATRESGKTVISEHYDDDDEGKKNFDNEINSAVATLNTHIQEWDGLASTRFREFFVNKIPVVTANQVSMTVAMQSVADACQAVYGCARDDLREVAKGTRDALNFHRPSGGSAVPIALSALAAGTAIAAGCFGGPGGIAIAVSAVSAGAGLLKDSIEAAEESEKDIKAKMKGNKYTINEQTVDGVLQRMYELVGQIRNGVIESEQALIGILKTNHEMITGAEREKFISPRPDFVDRPKDLASLTGYHGFYGDR